MNAGLLDRRFTFQTKTPTRDNYGQKVAAWTNSFTIFGQLIEMSGVERFEAAQLTAKADVKIIIRYRAGIVPTMRCFDVADVVYYDIVSVIRIGRKDTLELMAKKIYRT